MILPMWNDGLSTISAESPAYLSLLAAIPLIFFWSRRSLAGLGDLRRILALALRSSVAALLILALAGVAIVRRVDDQATVFLVDSSASVAPDLRARGLNFVRDASRAMRPDRDRLGVVSFNGAPSVEQLASRGLRIDRLSEPQRPMETNLAAGLRLSTAILPADAARRLVVISDGNSNTGDIRSEVESLVALNIPVDVLELPYAYPAEVVFERLGAPASALPDETVDLHAVIRATRRVRGNVRLQHNDALVDLDPYSPAFALPVELEAGANRISFPVPLRSAGGHRFRAVFEPSAPDDDALPGNNEAQALTLVGGEQRVLLLGNLRREDRPDDSNSARILAEALGREKIDVEVRDVRDGAFDAPTLMGYGCVILSNISAIDLGEGQQRALASYVRDLGGGLVVLGGDEAFSLGGYARTPLEEILPVETDRQKLNILSFAIALVIDRSGSMMGEKLHLAKAAAIGAVRLLTSHDRLAVIAFADAAESIVPMVKCDNRPVIEAAIQRVAVGGGTNMYPGLEQAAAALGQSRTNLQHIVVLTDGQSMPADFAGLARQMAETGITLSAIAVGEDADRALLRQLTSITGGRLYVTESAKPLPQIFARETVLATRSGLYERPFVPLYRPEALSSVAAGFSAADFPALGGYVITAAKPLAQVPLVRLTDDGSDPILAHWQVGLGRTVAFTGGMWPRWGADWVSWPGFSKLWSQAVRWASRPQMSNEFSTRITIDGDWATLILEAPADFATGRIYTHFDAQVIDPVMRIQRLPIAQTGPGRYESRFHVRDVGNYIVRAAYDIQDGPSRRSGLIQAAVSYSFSPEWRDVASRGDVLAEIAQRTGGRVLQMDHAAQVFEPWSVRTVEVRQPIWDCLTRLAVLLFLLDVAVRRVAFDSAAAARKARASLRESVQHGAGSTTEVTVSTLREAKERAQAEARPIVPPPDGRPMQAASVPPLRRTQSGVESPADPVIPEPGDVASRLRRAKRDALPRDEEK